MMGSYGLAPPGTITPPAGLGQMPDGLPDAFYGSSRPRQFLPNMPPQMPSDHFTQPPQPKDYMRPSPAEQEMYKKAPNIFGAPIAGLLHSDVPGRTDQLPISVEPGAYVIPADVVSGLGQGNTMAGATLLSQLMPHPAHRATGGSVVPIVAAGGEYIVHPDAVKAVGGGNLSKGHDILDGMVRQVRTHVAKRMLKLPGPRRD